MGAALAGAHAGSLAQAAGVARILVGFPAGGSMDVCARRLAETWRSRLAPTVLVEQRVGAGGRLAVSALKEASADGNTLLLSPSSMFTIYPHVYTRLAYRPDVDVAPVSPVAEATCAFAVGPMVPGAVRTLSDFVAWALAHPELASFASPAAGAMPHFLGTQFQHAARMTLTHVPYRGAVPGLQDLMGGQIASGCFALGEFMPHLATGRLRLLGVTDRRRSPFLPDVPTFAEQGFADVVGVETYGVFMPGRTPAAVLERVAALTRLAMSDRQVGAAWRGLGLTPVTSSPADYARRLQEERAQWGPVVRRSGFSSDE